MPKVVYTVLGGLHLERRQPDLQQHVKEKAWRQVPMLPTVEEVMLLRSLCPPFLQRRLLLHLSRLTIHLLRAASPWMHMLQAFIRASWPLDMHTCRHMPPVHIMRTVQQLQPLLPQLLLQQPSTVSTWLGMLILWLLVAWPWLRSSRLHPLLYTLQQDQRAPHSLP